MNIKVRRLREYINKMFSLEKRLFGKSNKKRTVTVTMTEDMNAALESVSQTYNRSKHDILLSVIDQFLQSEVNKGNLELSESDSEKD